MAFLEDPFLFPNMTDNARSFQKNFLTMLSGNAFSQLIPFFFAPFLSRIFTPEEFGIYGNFLAISSMIGIVATGRLEVAIVLPSSKDEAKKIVFTGFIFTLGFTLISLFIPIFSKQVAQFYNDPILVDFLWLIPFSVFSLGLVQLANNWILRSKGYQRLTISKIIQSIINSSVALILGYLVWGPKGLILAWILSQYFTFLVLCYKQFKINNLLFLYSWNDFKSVVSKYKDLLTINTIHAFLDLFVNTFLLFWMITVYFGKVELGLFSVMVRYLKAPIVLVSSSVSQLFFAETNTGIQNKTSVYSTYFKTLKTTALFSIPFVLGVLFIAPSFFEMYMGKNWINVGNYAQLYLPVLLTMFFVSPVSSIPILFQKQKQFFIINVIAYTISLGGFILGVKLGWNFQKTLLLYTFIFASFQIYFIIWFHRIIKMHELQNSLH